MEVLKCNAEFNKIYYIEIEGSLRQCKLIRTELSRALSEIPVYVLDVAQMGVTRIKAERFRHFDKWYHKSEIQSVLYESIEDYRNGKPITDNYGSTGNCYNSDFIEPLFTRCSPCNCGGYIYTWKWDGCKACRYAVNTANAEWSWDASGFHCGLNDMKDCYRTEQECIKANDIKVVTF